MDNQFAVFSSQRAVKTTYCKLPFANWYKGQVFIKIGFK